MTPQVFPVRFESPSGLSVQVNANGSIRRIDHRDIILNLFLGSEIEGGPANVYLRRHGAVDRVDSAARATESGGRLRGRARAHGSTASGTTSPSRSR